MITHMDRNHYWHEHDDAETEAAWHDEQGQGNRYAREREFYCVVVPCTKDEAIVLSKLFHKRFAIESCCHYDGETLSMYCGDAGSNADSLLRDIDMMAQEQGFETSVHK